MGRWMMMGYESVCELTIYTVASVAHEGEHGLMCLTLVFAEQRLLFSTIEYDLLAWRFCVAGNWMLQLLRDMDGQT
jgi:hypothetical protein